MVISEEELQEIITEAEKDSNIGDSFTCAWIQTDSMIDSISIKLDISSR